MSEVIITDPPSIEPPPTNPPSTDPAPVETTPTDLPPTSDPVAESPSEPPSGSEPDVDPPIQPEPPVIVPTEDELFLATLLQEQTATQERLAESTEKLNYLKIQCSKLDRQSRVLRDLIKVYEDRIALAANTSQSTV